MGNSSRSEKNSQSSVFITFHRNFNIDNEIHTKFLVELLLTEKPDQPRVELNSSVNKIEK
jgi:hypothetical protein